MMRRRGDCSVFIFILRRKNEHLNPGKDDVRDLLADGVTLNCVMHACDTDELHDRLVDLTNVFWSPNSESEVTILHPF